FDYAIYNLGDPVTGLVFTDNFGSNVTLGTVSGATCPTSGSNGTVVCTITGTIAPTATNSTTVHVRIPVTAPASAPTGTQFTNNPIPNMSNGPQSRPFEITTTARVTTPGSLFLPGGPAYALWMPIFGAGLLGASISRKRRLLLGAFFAIMLGVALSQAACGG